MTGHVPYFTRATPGFLLLIILLILGLLSACRLLTDQKATELVRLKYRQQSTTPGEGKWLIDSIIIDRISRTGKDSFSVKANVSGLYQLPVLEGTPGNSIIPFHDSVRFMALKIGKVWLTKRWELYHAE